MDSDPPTVRAARHLGAKLKTERREARIGTYWSGKLSEWLSTMRDLDPYVAAPDDLQTWSFPTDELLDEYLREIAARDVDEVMHLLRWFLFDTSTFGSDDDYRYWLLRRTKGDGEAANTEYERRLLSGFGRKLPAQPGIRWVLDLLPYSPRLALDAIGAYLQAHAIGLPDGRLDGLSDARALIHAYFVGRDTSESRVALMSITPRELEVLIARLYDTLGYSAELTPERSDGGRDVLARKTDAGRQHLTLIECKHHSSPVGVQYVRALLGAVAYEIANSGVLVAVGSFTRGAVKMAAQDPRIELVDGTTLGRLLNEHFSPDWPSRLDWLLRDRAREQ